jgi:alpha-amylase
MLSRSLRALRPFALALVAAVASCMDLPDGERPALTSSSRDWREDVIYQILIDRFANGDPANDYGVHPQDPARYHGGDWLGLEQQLDYIQALGVTALWISPVVKNIETDAGVDGYHGYWAQDLTQTNQHFGDLAALRRLVKKAHERNIKVIVDIVTNHMGQLFYYDINQNGQPDIQISESGTTGAPPGNPVTPKPVVHITEYDPDYDPRGIQSRTSLGEAGPAPIIFVYDPATNKVPALPAILQQASAYHRRGRVVDYDAVVGKVCDNDTRQPCTCTGGPKDACDQCGGAACLDYFDQTETGDFPGGLKDVATELPEVRAAMIDVYARWVEETNIDGFRIDTLKHVEHGFWRTFVPQLRARLAAQGKANFFIFGESFDGNDQRTGSYTRPGELDSVFYFAQKYQVFDDIFKRRPHGPTRKARDLWASRPANYGSEPQANGTGLPPTKTLVNFLDNHDVSRFLFEQPDPAALRAALLVLLTEDGIPCLYYGTEQEFRGGNDPANREDLWPTGYATGGETFRYVSRLNRLRRSYPALSKGEQFVVFPTEAATEGDEHVLAYERRGSDAGASYALVIMNADPASAHRTGVDGGEALKSSLSEGTVLVDILNGKPPITVGPGGSVDFQLDPLQGAILVPQDQVIAGL